MALFQPNSLYSTQPPTSLVWLSVLTYRATSRSLLRIRLLSFTSLLVSTRTRHRVALLLPLFPIRISLFVRLLNICDPMPLKQNVQTTFVASPLTVISCCIYTSTDLWPTSEFPLVEVRCTCNVTVKSAVRRPSPSLFVPVPAGACGTVLIFPLTGVIMLTG